MVDFISSTFLIALIQYFCVQISFLSKPAFGNNNFNYILGICSMGDCTGFLCAVFLPQAIGCTATN